MFRDVTFQVILQVQCLESDVVVPWNQFEATWLMMELRQITLGMFPPSKYEEFRSAKGVAQKSVCPMIFYDFKK